MRTLKNNEILLADVAELAKYDKERCRTIAEYIGKSMVSADTMIIPVIGGLSASSGDSWWYQSYTDIERDIQEALVNDSVNKIVLYIDSPGGEVAGCFSLCDYIKEAKCKKPITAFIARLGASAAYLIASSCTEVIAEPDAEIGSCGCMLTAYDYDDDYLKKEYGIIQRIFRSECSPKKNKSKVFDEEAAKEAQARVDEIGLQYLSYVADSRGMTLEEAKKKCGEGALLTSQQALEAGMIDKIQTYSIYCDEINCSPKKESEGANMDITKMSQEEKSKLFAELVSDNPTLLAPDREKVMKEERERITKLSALKKGDSDYDAIVDKAIAEGMSENDVKIALFDYSQTHPVANSKTNVLDVLANSNQDVNANANGTIDEFEKFMAGIKDVNNKE